MSGETTTLYDDYLKVFYLPKIQVAINKSSHFYFAIERDTESVVGKNATVALQLGLIPTYSRAEGGTIGNAGSIPKDQAIIPLYSHFCPIEFSNLTRMASRTNAGAYIKVMTAMSLAAVDSLRRTLNMQCALDNDGKLTEANATITTGAKTKATFTVDSTQYLWPGQLVDFLDPNDSYASMTSAGLTVNSVLSSTTFTATGTVATQIEADDCCYMYGNRAKQMGGFRDIFTLDNTYMSIDRSAVAEWNTQNSHGASVNRDLTMQLMQNVIDDCEQNAEGKISVIYCRPAVKRAYVELLSADRRFLYPNTLKLDGGFSGVEYSGGSNPIPIVSDRDFLPNKMYMVDMSTMGLATYGDFDWIPGPEDRILHPLITSSTPIDSVRGILRAYQNIFCRNCAKSGLLDYITEK